jgi:hypothetical protein
VAVVLQVMVLLHQVQAVEQVDLAVAVLVVEPLQVAQEFFTFFTRR